MYRGWEPGQGHAAPEPEARIALTLGEVGERLGISRRSAQRLTAAKTRPLPVVELGGSLRVVRVSALESWLAAQERRGG
jgi:predicted DNA-binding transcriptional regulator AlpA